MNAITFDTLKFVERLEKAGMSREQASAILAAQRDVLEGAMGASVATQDDINRVEKKLIEYDGKFTLLHWMLAFNLAFTMAIMWKIFG